MSNVVDRAEAVPRGKWFQRYLGRSDNLILELGCGRGEYALGLASLHPEAGVIGIDRNGARIWKGATRALKARVPNLIFLRTDIEYLRDHFTGRQVGQIWIPFPDPLRKRRQAKHRLVSPEFLSQYEDILREGGVVHLKTDSSRLFEYALKNVEAGGGRIERICRRVEVGGEEPYSAIVTTYEQRFREKGCSIQYLCFSFAPND